MTDQWVPGPPPVPPQWTNPLPPANSWDPADSCAVAPDQPSIVDGIVITGVPATVSSFYWQVSLNDGSSPPNFQINQLDGKGSVLDAALQISGADLSATFAGPVYLARDPVEPKEAVTLEYLEAHGAGVEEAPDSQTYGRTLGAWNLVVPASGGGYTGAVTLGAGGSVTSGALTFYGSALAYLPTLAQLQIGDGPAGQVPTADGSGNLTWTTPTTGGPYLPLAGGTVTGSLTVNQVLTVQGSNSLVLNAPVTGGSQRGILGTAATVTRWQMLLGDGTAEGANNAGANFSLSAYSVTGAFLGYWLTIARADGSTVFNGSGVTIQGGLAVNGTLALPGPNNFAMYGGSPGQFLQTNGSGILSWATPSGASITVSDTAPASPAPGALWWDSVGGQLYLWYSDANSSQWVVAVNAASLLQPASTTVLGSVKVDGTSIKAATDGTISTVLVPIGDNRIINGDFRIDQRNGRASRTSSSSYIFDRWQYYETVAGKFTIGGNLNSIVGPVGLPYVCGFQSIGARAIVAADTFGIDQPIEADQIGDFWWGVTGAQSVTLSFWAQSSLTGTFSGAIQNYAQTRSYPFSFSLPNANTWYDIVITIPGDTAGAWVMSGNAGSLYVVFDLGSGSTYRGPANAWAAANYLGVTGAVSVAAINGATFYVTGVKLEIGSVATPYNRQSLAKSMVDCQRYYQQVVITNQNTNSAGVLVAISAPFCVTMRAAPTMAIQTDNSISMGARTLSASAAYWYVSSTTSGSGAYVQSLIASASAEL